MPALEPATILSGRYHILRPVGRGGMGAVYEAIDLRLQTTVAVKAMAARGEDASRAFEREARLLASLRHEALTAVRDYFVEDGGRYLVMQYIEGEDLGALFRRSGALPEADVRQWGVAVLRALVYLHGQHPPIVHRDIKPSNIRRTPGGEIVLLDFGLAKGGLAGQASAGEERSIYGFTPGYAAPEQLAGVGTDPRSDLYALGATLFHLATGALPLPFDERLTATAGSRQPIFETGITHALSPQFLEALTRAVAFDPPARFQSADEMLRAIEDGSREERPSPPVRTRSRRVDAAAPSLAEQGREIDLLVQVRFADSPRLGLEDWPTRRRPDQIEQASESVHIRHPIDPGSGRRLPARLHVRLIAPDFDVRGAAEQLIDVPPDEYSKRLAFLLAPRRLGFCRVNVEVYAASEALFLGSIAVEAEAVSGGVATPQQRVADLVLELSAVEMPFPAAAAVDQVFDPMFDSEATMVPRSSAPMAIAKERISRADYTRSEAAPVMPAPAPGPRRGPFPRWIYAGTSMAVVVAAVLGWQAGKPPDSAQGEPPAQSGAFERPRPDAKSTAPAMSSPIVGEIGPAQAAVASVSHPAVLLNVLKVDRVSPTAVRIPLHVVNRSRVPVRVAIDNGRTRLESGPATLFPVVSDAAGNGPTGTYAVTIEAGSSQTHAIDFAVERPGTEPVIASLVLVGDSRAIQFPAVPVTLPAQ